MGVTTYTLLDGEVLNQNYAGTSRDYLLDPQGNTVATLDANHNTTDTFVYWPYGEERVRTGTTSVPFRYRASSGIYHDPSTANLYARSIYMRPGVCRWLTAGAASHLTAARNGYTYGPVPPSGVSSLRTDVPFARLHARGRHTAASAIQRALPDLRPRNWPARPASIPPRLPATPPVDTSTCILDCISKRDREIAVCERRRKQSHLSPQQAAMREASCIELALSNFIDCLVDCERSPWPPGDYPQPPCPSA